MQKDLDGEDTTTDDSEEEVIALPKPRIPRKQTSTSSDTFDDTTEDGKVDSLKSQETSENIASARRSASRKPRSRVWSAKDVMKEDDQSSASELTDYATNSKSSNPNTMKKPKHRLGKIGTRNKQPIISSDEENHPAKEPIAADMQSTSTTPTKKPKHKLGKIGGRAKSASSSDKPSTGRVHAPQGLQEGSEGTPKGEGDEVKLSSSPLQPKGFTGKPQIQANQSPPGRITEAQANENRERLKRELELKSSTASKKKRKF